MQTTARAEVVTGPAEEPLTLAEVRAHVELASGDTNHDTELTRAIEDARQQWERDTSRHYITRTMRLRLNRFDEFMFPHKPVSAVSSITYYDDANSSQTLSSSVYQLDTANNRLRLAYDQEWPTTVDRWDAVTVNYTLGEHADSTTVPAIAKRAMLLLVGYYFRGNRGDDDRANDLRAYEALVAKYMRSTYP
jgi:uncharacterized phiE125 gp8 family phage protein